MTILVEDRIYLQGWSEGGMVRCVFGGETKWLSAMLLFSSKHMQNAGSSKNKITTCKLYVIKFLVNIFQ